MTLKLKSEDWAADLQPGSVRPLASSAQCAKTPWLCAPLTQLENKGDQFGILEEIKSFWRFVFCMGPISGTFVAVLLTWLLVKTMVCVWEVVKETFSLGSFSSAESTVLDQQGKDSTSSKDVVESEDAGIRALQNEQKKNGVRERP